MKLDKDEIDRRVRRALEVVGLDYERFAERSPFDLSGGEKRRVAIAGVIAMEPKVLVLDEPVAGLDPAGREEILALVKKLQKEVSPTVIIVSHNMDDMAYIADRIVALKDGKIVADGTPKQVFGNRGLIVDAGLDLPTATRLTDALIARGVPLKRDIVTMDELAKELGEILKNKCAQMSDRNDSSDYTDEFDEYSEDDNDDLTDEYTDEETEDDVYADGEDDDV